MPWTAWQVSRARGTYFWIGIALPVLALSSRLLCRDRVGSGPWRGRRIRGAEQAAELGIGVVGNLAGKDGGRALSEQNHAVRGEAHHLIGGEQVTAHQVRGRALRALAQQGRVLAVADALGGGLVCLRGGSERLGDPSGGFNIVDVED